MLNYTTAGTGKPIFLIHGLFGSLENLGVIARQLQKHYQVTSIDLPDHGKSSRSDAFSFDKYGEAIKQVVEQVTESKAVLLGHSLGGKVAMHLSLHYPDLVDKLVVADIAPVSYEPRHQNVMAGLNAVDLTKITSRSDADAAMTNHIVELGVRQFLLKSLYKTDTGFAWRFNLPLLQRDYHQLSQGIDSSNAFLGETLFIKGGNSNYITADHQAKIKQLFPNAQAKIMTGTGHWLHAEKPFVFAGIVERFLENSK
ncbi:MAG: alpha/beta fold hydrolase [Alteromonadaceae bacterium]|nr:alpha/beta fold hydrolase [Alteromonadaceae bacterium]